MMEAKGFFSALFDYSFSSYITPKIIKILYVIATVLIALWTLAIVLVAFQASSAAGILALLIVGPVYFLISMIFARVGLEILSAFFHIHGDVQEINRRRGGAPAASGPAPPGLAAGPASEVGTTVPAAASPRETEQGPAATATGLEPVSEAGPAAAPATPEPASAPPPAKRYCENCGAERSPTSRFCTSCGHE
jgi:hypothetical protein